MSGGILYFLGLVLSSVAPNLYMLYVTAGLITGKFRQDYLLNKINTKMLHGSRRYMCSESKKGGKTAETTPGYS